MWHSGRLHTTGLELNPHRRKRGGREDGLMEVVSGSQKQLLDTRREHLGHPKRKASQQDPSPRYYSAANILILGF